MHLCVFELTSNMSPHRRGGWGGGSFTSCGVISPHHLHKEKEQSENEREMMMVKTQR